MNVVEGRRVIVCGGRDYADRDRVREILDEHVGQAESVVWPVLVHGGASGADHLADDWAMGRDVLIEEHKADWDVHGRAAGPIRNQEMADAGASLCIAFPGGKGTADMKRRARAAGIPVLDVP